MRTQRQLVLLLATLLLCAEPASSAHADFQFLTPSGNPTGASYTNSPWTSYGTYFTVSLNPNAAQFVTVGDATSDGDTWPTGASLLDILSAQGYDAAHGWTITRFDLEGSLTLGTYLAWSEIRPGISQGNLPSVPQENGFGSGGVAFGLGYSPSGGDPSGANAHWLQVVITTHPPTVVLGVTSGNLTYFIDNSGNSFNTPFYDGVPDAYANSTNFVDRPSKLYNSSLTWRALTFIATGDLNAKSLSISNQAIYWGFDDPVVTTPEPSTLILCLTGGVYLLGRRWQRRDGRSTMPRHRVRSASAP